MARYTEANVSFSRLVVVAATSALFLFLSSVARASLVNISGATWGSDAVLWDENGHIYELRSSSSGLTWDQARLAAESMSFDGYAAHLVTLNTFGENAWVWANADTPFTQANNAWLGAHQNYSDSIVTGRVADGAWMWINGDGAFYDGDGGSISDVPIHWASSEPNDGGDNIEDGEEDYLVYKYGLWNDVSSAARTRYVVEWEPSPVPLPSAAWFLGSGLIALIGFRSRKVQ